jgi:hypothetical protein
VSSPLACSILFVLVNPKCASRVCISYMPALNLSSMSASFPNFPPLQPRPQNNIENHTSPVKLSLDDATIVFISPSAVIAPITTQKRNSGPEAPFSKSQVQPHHLRRSSFSASPIRVAELASIREAFWDLEMLEPLVDRMEGKEYRREKYLVVARYPGLTIVLLE